VLFKEPSDSANYEDPVSLTAIHCAKSIVMNKSTKLSMSSSVLSFISKQFKEESLSYLNLAGRPIESADDENDLYDLELENKLSDCVIQIPLLSGGLSKEVKLRNASDLIDETSKLNATAIMTADELKNYKPTHLISLPDNYPDYQVKHFEKYLQIIYDESDGQKLYDKGRFHNEKYLELLNSKDLSWRSKSKLIFITK
jgi:hypothetical protein